MIYILIGVVVVLAVWVVTTYNFFVSSKARIKASVQEIGNQLKRQIDLIPNIVSSTKGYLKHEKSIFKDLTDARRDVANAVKSGNLKEMAKAGSKIAGILPALKIAVEDTPELKASGVVTKLMDELRDTADKVMFSRRLVIDLTADYNVKRVSFPSKIIADLFKFSELPGLITPEKGEHMEVTRKETETPKVKLG